jgi:hypothetical protein
MEYTYVTTACSNCKKTLFFKITEVMWFIRVTSGLGPNFVVCSSCNTRMGTTTKEWTKMPVKDKIWYVILSVVYGLLLGFITALAVSVTVQKLSASTVSSDLVGELVVASVTLIVFGIQMLRIMRSIERAEDPQGSSETISFWNWETNLQFYGMMWIILVMLGVAPLLYFF